MTWSSQRSALFGFIVGLAITVPATFFALLSPIGEALHPYLVPGTELLRPLAKETATWPGPVNVAVASLANGVIYAIGAAILGALMAILRHR